jgi:hypothetical protein
MAEKENRRKTGTIAISDVVWDPKVYPRSKYSTGTIERYADAMLAGDEFPPLVLEDGTNRLLDGKHRVESYKRAEITEAPVEWHTVPNGMSAKYYAATLSSRHGDRMSNADLKALAEEEFDVENPPDVAEWGKRLGVSQRTVYYWVSHLINRAKADREAKAWRLSALGWTQREIGDRLGVALRTSNSMCNNCNLAKIAQDLGEQWNEQGVAEWANRVGVSLTDAMAAAMKGMDDEARLKLLGIKVQPYDVWNFPGCHNLMGDKHPGRIPGEIICHALWYWTKQGDLVLDPMAGSGTTLDACLLMGRCARGYDIDDRHGRVDIEKHDLSQGWPDKAQEADLIFWDPPYFSKMDHSTIGDDGYIEGSISGLSPNEYLKWLGDRLAELHATAKQGARIAFLMSDWDPENAKEYADSNGIFVWDYADILRNAGWHLFRQVQVPLPTQQVHPDIVNKFRASRRMARLNRYLLGGVK